MKKLVILSVGLLTAVLAIVIASAVSKDSGQASGGPRVISVLGAKDIQGRPAIVDVLLFVAPGEDENAAAAAALNEQGARPARGRDLESAAYTTNGLVWDQLTDASTSNDFVLQNYNSAGDPTGGNGEGALTAAEATWTNVTSSRFAFSYGGLTSRCPSLVKECPGTQSYDGNNDVGWVPQSCNAGRCTLGVTWYSTSIDEADTALNSVVAWHAGASSCTNVSGQYDAQTVFLHELGHVAGLGHSSVPQAVMYAYYGGARCALHQDDIDGITALYPEPGVLPTPVANTPTVTATPTATPIPNCPPGQHKRGLC